MQPLCDIDNWIQVVFHLIVITCIHIFGSYPTKPALKVLDGVWSTEYVIGTHFLGVLHTTQGVPLRYPWCTDKSAGKKHGRSVASGDLSIRTLPPPQNGSTTNMNSSCFLPIRHQSCRSLNFRPPVANRTIGSERPRVETFGLRALSRVLLSKPSRPFHHSMSHLSYTLHP